MILTYEEVLRHKQAAAQGTGLYLHFHDGCGAQYFSFDTPPDADARAWLADYFARQGYAAEFSAAGTEFTLHADA